MTGRKGKSGKRRSSRSSPPTIKQIPGSIRAVTGAAGSRRDGKPTARRPERPKSRRPIGPPPPVAADAEPPGGRMAGTAVAAAAVAAGPDLAVATGDAGSGRRDSLVIGRTPALARTAGGLAAIAGLALAIRPLLPLGTTGGHRIGRGLGALGFLGWLPAAIVLVLLGAATMAGRLPRLGLAAVGAAGALGVGQLIHWLWLADTGARSALDLPVPGQAVPATSYSVGPGLVVAIVAALGAVLGALAAYASWADTVMEDDGRFDRRRPAFASAGLVVGAGTVIAFGAGPSSSALGIAAAGVTQASGWQLTGELAFVALIVVACAVAPTLRPRLAVVTVWLVLGCVLLGIAVENAVVVGRSPDLGTTFGTVAEPVAAGLVLVLAAAAAAAGERRTGA